MKKEKDYLMPVHELRESVHDILESDAGQQIVEKSKKGIYHIVFGRTGILILVLLIQMGILFFLFDRLQKYAFFAYGGLSLFALLVVVIIINRPGNPAFKLAWMVPITIVPVFGALFYLFVELQPINWIYNQKQVKLRDKIRPFNKQEEIIQKKLKEEDAQMANLSKYINDTGEFPIFENGEVYYFPLGEDKFQALVKELQKAEKFIFMEYFIVAEGRMWDQPRSAAPHAGSDQGQLSPAADDHPGLSGLLQHAHHAVLRFRCNSVRHCGGSDQQHRGQLPRKQGSRRQGFCRRHLQGHARLQGRFHRQAYPRGAGSRRPQHRFCRRGLRYRGRHLRLHHRHRSRLQDDQRDHRHRRQQHAARPAADHGVLHHSGNGRSHHGKLLHHGLHLRADPDQAGRSGHRFPLLRVLLRYRRGYHAAGRAGCICRLRHCQEQSDEDGSHGHASGHCRVHCSLRLRLQPGYAPHRRNAEQHHHHFCHCHPRHGWHCCRSERLSDGKHEPHRTRACHCRRFAADHPRHRNRHCGHCFRCHRCCDSIHQQEACRESIIFQITSILKAPVEGAF